ncbi:hypothetical protein OA526_03015 [Gammaproteobacteria bacterium]|nr:hypothetical protein [Gammaproteobacteria bacterium]
MNIPIIGILFFATIFAYFISNLINKNKESLLKLCFFFIPFSGVSLLNITELTFFILPFTLAALAWIILQLINMFYIKDSILIRTDHSFVLLSLSFLVLVAFSSLMPILINGTDGYFGANDDSLRYFPIKPSNLHLLQLIYVFIGIIFSIFVIGFVKQIAQVESIIRVIFLSAIIACLIGIIEILSFYFGVDLKTDWYHTVPTGDGSEKGVRLDGILNIVRINSVSYETSIFAQHMLVPFSFAYFSRMENLIIFSKKKDKYIFWLLLSSLIIALSTTAIAGIFIIYFIYWLLNITLKRTFLAFILVCSLIFLTYIFYTQFEFFAAILDVFVLGKLSGGSVAGRFEVAVNSFDVFVRNPYFGVGFGILPPSDLILMLLSGVGIFGTIVFTLMIFLIIYNGIYGVDRSKRGTINICKDGQSISKIDKITKGLTFSFVILLIVYQGLGFNFRFGDFWCLSGLLVSCCLIRDKIVLRDEFRKT